MTRRLLPSASHSWLMTATCCALALLTAGEPARLLDVAVQHLLDWAPSGSRSAEDDEGADGKVTASVQAARRSFRKQTSTRSGYPRADVLSPRAHSSLLSRYSPPAASPTGELAFHNGFGAPLRC